ncbi:uncharacterized protein [Watersipora subatra]|uniref:uncharacterized protein n=1 Tax=Watersipora subatra TaxID=2589382 RepID=UPI00355C0464
MILKRRHIAELKLQAEVEAGKAQQRAYENTLEQEQETYMRNSLLRPPSKASQLRALGSSPDVGSQAQVSRIPMLTQSLTNQPIKLEEKPDISPTVDLSTTIAKAVGESMAKAMTMERADIPKPEVFDGDPLKYNDWQISFAALIDMKPYSAIEKLQLLKEFVSGEAKEAISSFFSLNSNDAYQEALDMLHSEYGADEMVEEKFKDRLEQWPKISGRDFSALKHYSYFLNACVTAMNSIPGLNVLNQKRENRNII